MIAATAKFSRINTLVNLGNARYNTGNCMKALWKALAAIVFALAILGRSSSPAFATNPNGMPEECFNEEGYAAANPDKCDFSVGGTSVTVDDIRNAINSPTPNLANTTAYIVYTITVIMQGTVDFETGEQGAANGAGSLMYPSDLSDATSKQGIFGGLAYLTAEMISNPPASSGTYLAYVAQNSRFAGDQAYAQGVGFGSLNPILGTWVAFRDVAYYLLILMFFVSGFLILIRHKISGQVAVTVQTILPRLVLTLILITFSYAIAGFIVDAMFLAIYFVINIFDGAIFKPDAVFRLGLNRGERSLTDLALNTNIIEFIVGYVFNTGPNSAWGAATALGNIVYTAINAATGDLLSLQIGKVNVWEAIISVIFTLIFGVALLVAMFRTFFSLLMSYAGFVVNVVMAPFILLPGVIPNNGAFANWIKNLIAGLAPFVVAIFMIFMALALTGGPDTNQPGVGYRPPYVSGDDQEIAGLRLPLILTGDIDISAFMGIIAMGFMLLLPEAVGITKKLVGAKGGIFDEYQQKAVDAFKKGSRAGKIGARAMVGVPAGMAVGAVGGGIAKGLGLAPRGTSWRKAVGVGAGAGAFVGGGGLGAAAKGLGMVNRGRKTAESMVQLAEGGKAYSEARRTGADVLNAAWAGARVAGQPRPEVLNRPQNQNGNPNAGPPAPPLPFDDQSADI